MSAELAQLFLVAFVYLALLFLLAHFADRGLIPTGWVNHPLTYTLSLGVYATSWSYYGSVGFAAGHGYAFLAIYLGATLTFALAPLLLRPIMTLSREYQLGSLADLLAFRYRSQAVGILVTLFMLVGTLPYIALQIRAVTGSIRILTEEVPPNLIALGFCVSLILFGGLFGVRHVSPRQKHQGLVAVIAFESLIKLVIILVIGVFALFGVFGGLHGLDHWLATRPDAVIALYKPVNESPWTALVFLSFAAAFLLPRQFHMLVTENINPRALDQASWGFPLYLLLLNLPIPVILWAGDYLQLDMHPDFFLLGITLAEGPRWLSLLAFVGGLSASSAMVIVTSLALATMTLNHLLLPTSYPDPKQNLYRSILWSRRLLIGLIILAGYGFYSGLQHNQGLVQLGLISFVAVAQFLPGVAALLFWQRATRTGFIAGLLGGIAVWILVLIVPLFAASGVMTTDLGIPAFITFTGMDKWAFATFSSVCVNGGLLVLFSLLSEQSPGEERAAHACASGTLVPLHGVVALQSPSDFRTGLAHTLGATAADREVRQALGDLGLGEDERRASELRRLRDQLERNLSGLLGPQLADMIVTRRLELDTEAKIALADSLRYVEEKLEDSRSRLAGMNAQLDTLRRLHRQILRDLPLGVCATDDSGSIVLWNVALEHMTGLGREAMEGRSLSHLPPPWKGLLQGFAKSADDHIYRMDLPVAGKPRWFNLHKAVYTTPDFDDGLAVTPGIVMLIEDLTDLSNLEAELAHNDRLVSVGRLAAGVAHEIGNPVTGIDSLAQNLRHETDHDVIRTSVEDILQQTRRISAILKTLKSFSRGSQHLQHREIFSLHEVVEESIQLLTLAHKERDIHFEATCSGNAELLGNRQQIAQVLVNLLSNAADASRQGDRVDLIGRREGDEVVIEIMDQGAGIAEDIRDLVLEPFFTTKPTGKGTGLGLSLAYQIIEEHKGTLDIDSQVDVGTRMSVRLPVNQTETQHASSADR